MGMRTESDSIGDSEVAADAYWGAQTERSRHNCAFPAHERMPLPIVHALARIKGAAARVNRNHGLDAGLAEAIAAAAEAVVTGDYDDPFQLAISHAGIGTHTTKHAHEGNARTANEARDVTRRGQTHVQHPPPHPKSTSS